MINILGMLKGSSNWTEMEAVTFYRSYLPLREITRQVEDMSALVAPSDVLEGVIDEELGGRDIYVHYRMPSGAPARTYINEVHRRGGVVVFDSDDDLTNEYRLTTVFSDEIKYLMGEVDYVTCSRPELADRFAQYTKVHPTALLNYVDVDWMADVIDAMDASWTISSLGFYDPIPWLEIYEAHAATLGKSIDQLTKPEYRQARADAVQEHGGDPTDYKTPRLGGIVMGFSGSPTHWGDWYIPSVPFSRIIHEFRDIGVEPLLQGQMPIYLSNVDAGGVLRYDGVNFVVYPYYLNKFDVLLCGVDPKDEFNSGKSAVKALECMALGIVPICSRFKPYMELYEAGAPLVLVEEDTRDAWYEAMRDLIQDEEKRLTLKANGPGWVKANRDMTVDGYKQWEDFYRGIVDKPR